MLMLDLTCRCTSSYQPNVSKATSDWPLNQRNVYCIISLCLFVLHRCPVLRDLLYEMDESMRLECEVCMYVYECVR